MDLTEKFSEEHGGFRKGKGYMDQVFAMKMVVEKYLVKGLNLYATFINKKDM